MLGKLARQHDPNVLVGFDHADDAGVYLISPEQALVQTVDFFTPVVDDPYTFGQIAQREDVPLQVLKTSGPYPEAVDLSVSPLSPGQSKPFRLTFEGISAQWNRQYPDIHVTDVAAK